MSSASDTITGRCLCGKLQYEVQGPPMTTALCYCENCRRATGSSFMANSIYKRTQLKLLHGNPDTDLRVYEDKATASGNVLYRSFCGTCGSPLFASNQGHPLSGDMLVVMSGTMDRAPEMWAPQKEFFCKSRGKWIPRIEGTDRIGDVSEFSAELKSAMTAT